MDQRQRTTSLAPQTVMEDVVYREISARNGDTVSQTRKATITEELVQTIAGGIHHVPNTASQIPIVRLPHSAVNVIACNAASTSGSWCCAYDGNCCSNSTQTYVPSFGTIFAEPGTSSTSSTGSSTATSSASSTSSSSTSSIASTSATTTPTASSSAQNSTSSASGEKSNTGTIVGAAVGVPLGLAALAGLFLFWRERNKRKNLEQEIPEKTVNDFVALPPQYPPGAGQQQAGYDGGYGQGGIGAGDARPRQPTKTYEMSDDRTAELPAAHGQHELVSMEYEGHGQQGGV
ncbi:uncharacterized protein PAC_09987 [Phialocephala subalpina]|uniref:Mid2 domain-containing protein n=1 Tax=Phialocephala subalpina TaxID=576137 RepID=A0A1L7X4Z0_9HELO|nr:uncharacterized protein PAC_09987 [Phialocephala subalpina]